VVAILSLVPSACLADSSRPSRKASTAPSATPATPDKTPSLPSSRAAEDRLLASAGKGFKLHHTSHFVLACNVSQETLNHLLSRLEATYYKVHSFCRVGKIPVNVSGSKLEVILFDQWADYAAWVKRLGADPVGTYGLYDQRSNRSAFYNLEHDPGMIRLRQQVKEARANLTRLQHTIDALAPDVDRIRLNYPDGRSVTVSRNEALAQLENNQRGLRRMGTHLTRYGEKLNQSVIQHEAAHHIMFAGHVLVPGADNPAWLVEGLACQFEVPPGSSGQEQSTISQYRLGEFRDACDKGCLLSLTLLLSDSENLVRQTNTRAVFYGQAWGLVYYLKKKYPDRFAAYVRALGARRPGLPVAAEQERSDYRRFFGPPDEAFVRRWETHILALPYRSEEVRP
jgi:hypothetical protein